MIGSLIPFAGGLCLMETRQLICSENYLTGFCMLRVSTDFYGEVFPNGLLFIAIPLSNCQRKTVV